MGQAAATEVSRRIRAAIAERESASTLLSAAPSQNDFLEALAADESIDWSRVYCLHIDEYHAPPAAAPPRFDGWLKRRIIDRVTPAALFEMAPEPGMGENAHISEAVPSSILRSTPWAIMFIHADAASLLQA